MKKILLLTFLNLFWIFCSIEFTILFTQDHDFATFVPCLIFYLITIVFSYLFIVEIFLGHKTYTYDDDSLHIWRKGKIRKCIQKENVSKINLILDVFSQDLYLISFVYENKKHYVSINKDNEETVLQFISGKKFVQKKNWWYYLIVFFSHQCLISEKEQRIYCLEYIPPFHRSKT